MKAKKLIVPTLLLLALGTACGAGGADAPSVDPRTSPAGDPAAVAPQGPVAPVFDCSPLQGSYSSILGQQADAQETANVGNALYANVLQIQGTLPNVETCAIPGDFSSYTDLKGPVRDPSCVAEKLGEMEPIFSQALTGTSTSFAIPYSAETTALTKDVNYFRQVAEDASGIDMSKVTKTMTAHNNWLAQVNSTQANLDTTKAEIASAPSAIQPKYDRALQLFNTYSGVRTAFSCGIFDNESCINRTQSTFQYAQRIKAELDPLLMELYGITLPDIGQGPFDWNGIPWDGRGPDTGKVAKYFENFTPQMTGAENNGVCLMGCPPELGDGSLFQKYDSLLDSVPGLEEQLAEEMKKYIGARNKLVKELGLMAFAPLTMTADPSKIQTTAWTYSTRAQSYNEMLKPIYETLVANGCEVPVLEVAP